MLAMYFGTLDLSRAINAHESTQMIENRRGDRPATVHCVGYSHKCLRTAKHILME